MVAINELHVLCSANLFNLRYIVYPAIIHDQHTILTRIGIHDIGELIHKLNKLLPIVWSLHDVAEDHTFQ